MQSPYLFWEQLLFVLVLSPILSLLCRLLARGWATAVQEGKASEKTIARQRTEFLAMLISIWAVGFGVIIFVHVLRH
jgi:hypothetical protein